jgi:hypothetical protein
LHDVGIEHGEERVEVSIARGGEEGFNDFFLPLFMNVQAVELSEGE